MKQRKLQKYDKNNNCWKIKEKYLTDAINEYLKRLSKYTKINLIEVPDENFDITKTLETEKKSILKYVSEKDYIITMEIDGKELSSIEFAKKQMKFK